MLVLAVGSRLVTGNLSLGSAPPPLGRILLEIVVTSIEKQISDVGLGRPRKYLGFLGTTSFVASANLFTIIPGYEPPTGLL